MEIQHIYQMLTVKFTGNTSDILQPWLEQIEILPLHTSILTLEAPEASLYWSYDPDKVMYGPLLCSQVVFSRALKVTWHQGVSPYPWFQKQESPRGQTYFSIVIQRQNKPIVSQLNFSSSLTSLYLQPCSVLHSLCIFSVSLAALWGTERRSHIVLILRTI